MRQRKVKNEAERLNALKHLQIDNSYGIKGSWKRFLKEKHAYFEGNIYLEIGCGRGHFLAGLGEFKPKDFFLGIESRSSVVLPVIRLLSIFIARLLYIDNLCLLYIDCRGMSRES